MSYRKQKNVTLTKEQAGFARKHYKKMMWKEIAEKLGITYNRLMFNARVMGILKEKKLSITVNKRQENLIRKYYGKIPNKELADRAGIKTGKLMYNARFMGLTKEVKVIDFDKNGFFDIDAWGQVMNL